MNSKAAGLGLAAMIAALGPSLVPTQVLAAGECPTDEACLVVTVKGPTPSVTAITYSSLDNIHDLDDAAYRVRSAAGQTPTADPVHEAISLNRVLTLALNLDPGAVNRLNLDVPGKPTGTRTTSLAPNQLGTSGGGFENGLRPAITLADGKLGYVRPLLAGDASDVNAVTDSWTTTGQVTRMTVWTSAERLSGHVVATRTSVKPEVPVTFSVAFDGKPDTSGLSYTWTFCDGAKVTTAAATRSWKKPSKDCAVSVAVNGVGVTGDIDPVTIQVTAKPTYTAPTSTLPSAPPTTSSPTPGGTTVGGGLAQFHDPGLQILRGRALPEAAGTPVLTAPVVPGTVTMTDEGLVPVAGEFLETASGELAPAAGEVAPTTTDDPTPKKHRAAVPSWLWYLLAPVLVTAGALVELRPRRRLPRRKMS